MLVRRMDEMGIQRAVVMPLGLSPEALTFGFTNEQALESCAQFPNRLIPFCHLDPRMKGNRSTTDFTWLLEHYMALGCRGVGEMLCGLHFDDPRVVNLLRQCGELGMPVTYHAASSLEGQYGLADDQGLPRTEKVLRELPQTILLAHGHSFWAEMSADVNENERGYRKPTGPVRAPGRVAQLLDQYPNLYGDLSAGSAYNALTRDREYGVTFLNLFQDKLLFGTDLLAEDQNCPIVGYLKNLKCDGLLNSTAYEKITHLNAERILGLTSQ